MEFVRVIFTALGSLTALFLLTKLMGNKQMSELNMFDYINGITIGSIAAEMATGEMSDFFSCLIAIVIYALVAVLLSFLSQKSLMLRRFFTGKSIVLYDKGKLYRKNLRTAKIDVNEFLVLCRTKGYFKLEDIQMVILEANGQLSILPNDKNRPLTPDDIKVKVHQTRPEVVVINDGEILEKNLKYSGNNISWLENELERQRIKADDVYVAICDNDNNLKIYKKLNENPTEDIFD